MTAADGMFAVTVADTGPGIAEAEQQKIFEELQQAESAPPARRAARVSGWLLPRRSLSCTGGGLG